MITVPSIAVVMPVYNGEATIEIAIQSLLNQTFKNWILIVVNDGSVDNTFHVLKKYKNDERIVVVSYEINRGRSFARKIALEKVIEINAKYMCMLDADDWYYPNKLQFQFDIMESHPQVTLLSSAIGVAKNELLHRVIKPYPIRKKIIYSNFMKYCTIPHASSIIRVEHIYDLSYNLKMYFSEDQDFLRRLLINRHYIFDPEIQYIYNREDSFSVFKYVDSMKANIFSINELPLNFFLKKMFFIKCELKIIIIKIIFHLGIEKYYFEKIGEHPISNEIKKFNSVKSILKHKYN